jgi:hypothetical protein
MRYIYKRNERKMLFLPLNPILPLLAVVALLSGCASGQLKLLPEPTGAEGVAEVVVIRNKNVIASGNIFKLQLNGEDVAVVRTGEYLVLRISAGRHTLGVKSFGGLTPTTKVNTIEIEVEDRERRYYLMSLHFSKNAELELISVDDAQQRIKRSEEIPISYEN